MLRIHILLSAFRRSGRLILGTSCAEILWSVKYRRKVITPEVESFLQELVQTIAQEHGFVVHLFEVGSRDHVHCFVSAPPKMSISDQVRLYVMAPALQPIGYKVPKSTFINMWGDVVPIMDVYSKLAAGTQEIMQDNLLCIILYGSVARGTETPGSDIDIAIIATEWTFEMHDQLLELFTDLNLEYDILLSPVMIELEYITMYENKAPFLLNLKKDGIVLWSK